jgi:hypothetical protein
MRLLHIARHMAALAPGSIPIWYASHAVGYPRNPNTPTSQNNVCAGRCGCPKRSFHDGYFVVSGQTGSPLSNTIRQVWGASSRQIELNRPTTLSFTITGPVLRARSPDASTST